jgi:hypothetical protein
MDLGAAALLLAATGVNLAWPIASGATLLSLGLFILGVWRFKVRSGKSR